MVDTECGHSFGSDSRRHDCQDVFSTLWESVHTFAYWDELTLPNPRQTNLTTGQYWHSVRSTAAMRAGAQYADARLTRMVVSQRLFYNWQRN